MKIINTIWFSKIGIVMGKDEVTNEPKAYIGLGAGINEEADIKYITKRGSKFTKKIAQKLSKHYEL